MLLGGNVKRSDSFLSSIRSKDETLTFLVCAKYFPTIRWNRISFDNLEDFLFNEFCLCIFCWYSCDSSTVETIKVYVGEYKRGWKVEW